MKLKMIWGLFIEKAVCRTKREDLVITGNKL